MNELLYSSRFSLEGFNLALRIEGIEKECLQTFESHSYTRDPLSTIRIYKPVKAISRYQCEFEIDFCYSRHSIHKFSWNTHKLLSEFVLYRKQVMAKKTPSIT